MPRSESLFSLNAIAEDSDEAQDPRQDPALKVLLAI
jgi:hypothetical protein